MNEPLQIFLGFDPRFRTCYDVAKWSITKRASVPVLVKPIKLEGVKKQGIMERPVETKDGRLWCPISQAPMSTEFAITRFAVPFLTKHKGWALFADSDVLCLDDIAKLFALTDEKFAVMVVKHDQKSTGSTKMDGQVQTAYDRKNWSSVVLWNTAHPAHAALTKEVLNTWPGRDLHAFKWLKDDEIGELPKSWNVLIGEHPKIPGEMSILHYTLGGPWLPEWSGGAYDKEWTDEYADFTANWVPPWKKDKK